MIARGDARRSTGLKGVYFAHRQDLVRFLRARGAGDAADDLVQELWLKLSQAKVGPIADPLGYLYRAASNLMIERHRSAVRRERREGEYAADGREDGDWSLDQLVTARQEIVRAEQRLRALGERVLRVFVMFRVDGVPQRDIAAELGISLSAVEKDLQRAYRAIAGLRDEADAGDPDGRRL